MNKPKSFRTEVNVEKVRPLIDYNTPVLSVGSCFAFELYKKIKSGGFKSLHPGGVIYNPISISTHLNNAISAHTYGENDIISHDDIFFSWNHSGKNYHANSIDLLLQKLNKENNEIKEFIDHKPVIIVTFGTAIIYELKSTGQIVANCHKQSQSSFQKRMLEVDEIVTYWTDMIQKIEANFIFTVSPVRHLKDGFIENNRSKSKLILAVHQIIENHSKKCFYFPSYEILMDELRDYRFYSSDWIHPNEEAVNYIWDKFADTFFDQSTKEVLIEVGKLRKALNHKPMFEVNLSFYEKLKNDIQKISQKTSLYNWKDELNQIDEILAKKI